MGGQKALAVAQRIRDAEGVMIADGRGIRKQESLQKFHFSVYCKA